MDIPSKVYFPHFYVFLPLQFFKLAVTRKFQSEKIAYQSAERKLMTRADWKFTAVRIQVVGSAAPLNSIACRLVHAP